MTREGKLNSVVVSPDLNLEVTIQNRTILMTTLTVSKGRPARHQALAPSLRLPLHLSAAGEVTELNFLLKAGSVGACHKGWKQTHRKGPQCQSFLYGSSFFHDPQISLPPPVHTVMNHIQLLHPNTQFRETHGFLALKWSCLLFSFLCYPVASTSDCTLPC